MGALLCAGASLAQAQQAPPSAANMSFNATSTLADPLENYYGNTLVCAAALTQNDLCHLWLNRDGTFINFDQNGAHTGHYSVGPMRPDGKVPVCQYWDTPNMIIPAEIAATQRMPGPMPAAAPQGAPPAGAAPAGGPAPAGGGAPAAPGPAGPGGGMVMLCENKDYRTTCRRGLDAATLSEEQKKMANRTMGERFNHGMCYPLGPHNVGDTWWEEDDPLPGQAGKDKLLLLSGRR
ncbi:MAG: hypothetical protein QM718_11665 [Steroidobacteraceae bacterium]